MRTFLFTSDKFGGEVAFAFAPGGILHRIENRSDMTESQLTWVLRKMPVTLEAFLPWVKESGMPAIEVPQDLSFDAFWAVWPGVVANRAKALVLWEKMSKSDKAICLFGCPAYRRYISRSKHW
jgi:hypothetical protein